LKGIFVQTCRTKGRMRRDVHLTYLHVYIIYVLVDGLVRAARRFVTTSWNLQC
jgi:hypothetical protein